MCLATMCVPRPQYVAICRLCNLFYLHFVSNNTTTMPKCSMYIRQEGGVIFTFDFLHSVIMTGYLDPMLLLYISSAQVRLPDLITPISCRNIYKVRHCKTLRTYITGRERGKVWQAHTNIRVRHQSDYAWRIAIFCDHRRLTLDPDWTKQSLNKKPIGETSRLWPLEASSELS